MPPSQNIEQALAAAQAELSRNTDIKDSVKQAFTVLLGLIESNKNAPETIQAIVDTWRANNDETVAAVLAATPVSERR